MSLSLRMKKSHTAKGGDNMSYEYKGFIPQNIALQNTKKIGVYDSDGNRVVGIMLSGLTPVKKQKLYSFGLISDTHIQPASSGGDGYSIKLDNALGWFEEQGCEFVAHCGDITNHGLWNSDGSSDLAQFAEYKRICDLHNIPVYAACGNHDSYFKAITETLTELRTYTGHDLYFKVEQGNDLFFFAGQSSSAVPMSDETLTWLTNELANSNGKRCFLFMHPCMRNDSGNALGAYASNMYLETWGKLSTFQNLLRTYNVTVFHGHSHLQFNCQEVDECANYTDKNGYKSVHVPSLCGNRTCYDGEIPIESQGYIVDVYKDCIVLRGRDFGTLSNNAMINPKWIPIASYKI